MTNNGDIVQIREKLLKDGRKSLYLTYRINGKRFYEYPKLYLLPEYEGCPTSDIRQNKTTMRLITALKSKRLLALTQDRSGIKIIQEQAKIPLLDYCQSYLEYKERRGKKTSVGIKGMMRYLEGYIMQTGKSTLTQVDKRFCCGFARYLAETKGPKGCLVPTTQSLYFNYFSSVLRRAVVEGYISQNPCTMVDAEDKPHPEQNERVYLDIAEVKFLCKTEAEDNLAKQAFLFSCFTGLRWSDIHALKWKDIKKETDSSGEQRFKLSIRMEKTKGLVSFFLSDEALRWLPQRIPGIDVVFPFTESRWKVCRHVQDWCKKAGIDKNVTFHSGRHTFATMLLTLGADLYTVSKLLGHSNIRTTQIYAQIVDKKKEEAVSLINKLF